MHDGYSFTLVSHKINNENFKSCVRKFFTCLTNVRLLKSFALFEIRKFLQILSVLQHFS